MNDVCAHECLECNPNIAPDFDYNDPRYHRYDKCGVLHVTLDGVAPGYTSSAFEGKEGWLLFAGNTVDEICTHECVNGPKACLKILLGNVSVSHDVHV